MKRPQSFATPLSHIAIAAALTLTAALGWGLLLLKMRSAAEFEEHLRAQVSSLHQTQLELLSERAQMQAEIAVLRKDRETLTKTRDQMQAELARVRSERDEMVKSLNAARVEQTGADRSATSGAVVAAQKALSDLGYGPLQGDGILGPSTRQAIEDFQHDQGLTVTSELDPPTLRRLIAPDQQTARRE
ncbi:peptidoglycan-binding protein [Microvirga sp. GCM10011540]|uniref:peptidoglycan-binding domain-containing protein n=1 Tax=Microvirga sp. GCM10011540 TaxID=3317338 RepID=UPI0036067FF0